MAGIYIRELFPQVTSRPEILPGDMRTALMEAGIVVCRQSNLLKQEVFATLPQGATRLTIPAPADQDIVRVDQVFYRDPSRPTQGWSEVREIAPVYLERMRLHVDSHTPTVPNEWGLRGSTLFFNAPTDSTYPLRISYTWAPTRASRPEVFDLPFEAEPVILAYAKWILLQDLDPRAAEAARMAFLSGMADLRGKGDTGESGDRSIYDFLPYDSFPTRGWTWT